MKRSRRERFFVLLLGVFFAFTCLGILFPQDPVILRSLFAATWAGDRQTILVYGNSVVDAKSPCDGDKRTISEMLHQVTGRETSDLSQGGQYLDFSLPNSSIVTGFFQGRDAVVFVSLFHFNAVNSNSLWKSVLFRLMAGKLSTTSLQARYAAGVGISGASSPSQKPFTYKGIDYPDYLRLSSTYYTREKNAMTCPTSIGIDLRFIEANYWKAYLLSPVVSDYFADLRTVQQQAKFKGNRLTYVLLPIDFEDVEVLDKRLAEDLRERLQQVRSSLKGAGIDYLDLAEALPASAFADRFCACGHLAEDGRRFVAEKTGELLVKN